jgi:transcriptional regulator with XRE-family HTH domain
MLNIGARITELRKAKGLSQSELAKALNASRDIIGKYERNENDPSIEMANKIADIFGVSLDYLLGKERKALNNKEAIKRLEEIEYLDMETRKTLFNIIDTFIRDSKTRQAYAL